MKNKQEQKQHSNDYVSLVISKLALLRSTIKTKHPERIYFSALNEKIEEIDAIANAALRQLNEVKKRNPERF